MIKQGLFWLFLAISQQAGAQFYFRGSITDEKRQPLQNAKIYLHSSHLLFRSGVAGDFGINTSHLYDTITVFLDGYEEKKQPIKTDLWTDVVLKQLASHANKNKRKLISVTKDLNQSSKMRWQISEETYFKQVENETVPADKYPNTGFSLNVNKASYSNMRRFLNMGSTPPPDAVRIEELLNYFNLCYQEPPPETDFTILPKLSTCPWSKENQLLFLNINAKKIDMEKVPPGNFVFLIDVSGSMDMPNRLPLLKAGFQMLVKNLRNIDTVTIVTYGGYTGVHLFATSGAEKEKITAAIEKLEAAGDTPGESAIRMAYQQARSHFIKGGSNRVILATDGDFNVGKVTEKELEDLIVIEKQSGVHLTCLGVGMGNYKDSKLETLAKKGNGNFAYIDDLKEAEKVLVTELTQTIYNVAEDVFLNINFNNDKIKEYRLIGFDNKKDAVADSTTDMEGGEVGSGNSVLAIFEITPTANAGTSTGNLATLSLKYKLANDSTYKTHHQTINSPLVEFKDLEKELRFGTSIAMFGMRMRESKFAKNISWDELEIIAENSYDPSNFLQTEFVELVHKAKKICTRKRKRDD